MRWEPANFERASPETGNHYVKIRAHGVDGVDRIIAPKGRHSVSDDRIYKYYSSCDQYITTPVNREYLFHEASVHIVGIFYMGKDGARLRGFETWADKDGDKLIWEIREKKADDSPPGTLPGTGEVFSGTGKYVGMQGTMDYLVRYCIIGAFALASSTPFWMRSSTSFGFSRACICHRST